MLILQPRKKASLSIRSVLITTAIKNLKKESSVMFDSKSITGLSKRQESYKLVIHNAYVKWKVWILRAFLSRHRFFLASKFSTWYYLNEAECRVNKKQAYFKSQGFTYICPMMLYGTQALLHGTNFQEYHNLRRGLKWLLIKKTGSIEPYDKIG